MDINLLGDDDDDSQTCNLQPALQPQRPDTAPLEERMARLSTGTLDHDDFGDLLHSSSTADAGWAATDPAPPADGGDELQPAPAAGRRDEHRDPAGADAEQVLGWILHARVPEPPGAESAAWESAEGLMGGDPSLHLGEIASRLCSIIPEMPQVAEPPEDPERHLAPLDPVYAAAKSAGPAEAMHLEHECQKIGERTCALLWPLYSVPAADVADLSDKDALVTAYMGLAEKVNRS
ncbi:hypothetical protein H4R18_003648 [Coemansia javaensis]|uniref:Uncharacterized protein n=1 Tax=Coemansia javaensis TaxID=2761396 RepID=A0A9W8LI95_9FUNG|nr:hypothetical protein H4R18_003648 [Coemansia javaensis]